MAKKKKRKLKKKKLKFRWKHRKLRKEFLIFLLSIMIVIVSSLSIILFINIRNLHKQEETPVKSNMVENTYDWKNLKEDGDLMSYEDDRYTSMQGIDVSAHQGTIDWAKVKEAGIEFAYIRVGYRGYETGIIHKDEYFDSNIRSAKENGIKVGVYFFSQAVDVDEAREEAEFTIKQIKDYEIDLPVAYDIEEAGEGNGRVDDLSSEIWTQNAVTFLHVIENAGYEGMNYNSTDLFDTLFENEYLQEFDTWVAHYDVSHPYYEYTFLIWQYSCEGKIDGIEGKDTDMDIMFVEK